jgi:hypothetical protein
MRPFGAAVLLLALFIPVAAETSTQMTDSPAPARQAVVLLHHVTDGRDLLGVPFGPAGNDTFSSRYEDLTPAGGFPFPSFLADGGGMVSGTPDDNVPFESTLDAYTRSFDAGLANATAVPAIWLAARAIGPSVHADISVSPNETAAASPSGQEIHALTALTEDNVFWRPPDGSFNGVANHRFTVRALADLGVVDLARHAATNLTHDFAVDETWRVEHLVLAVWLQTEPGGTNHTTHHVLQAASATVDGPPVMQTQKAVLLELYSATWCRPCLYGDRALEALAIQFAGASPPPDAAAIPGYFQPPANAVWVALAAAAAGVGIALAPFPRMRRDA